MADFDLMAAAAQLGAEFRRRRMDSHLLALRRFYTEHRRRRQARVRAGDKTWDESMVIGWLSLLRIPPFDHTYPVLPRGASCPKCSAVSTRAAPATFVRSSWPGGFLEQCRQCETSWLHEETIDGAGSG